MYYKILRTLFIALASLMLFKETSARSDQETRRDLQPIIMEERNQQLCEGPLHTNCPRDGKILGDLSWSPFSDAPKAEAPPPEAIPAEVDGIEYSEAPHPLET